MDRTLSQTTTSGVFGTVWYSSALNLPSSLFRSFLIPCEALIFEAQSTRILSKKAGTKVTPMMRQFNEIKQKHPDALLLFRVGDFYETFGEDAQKAAEALDIILTKRSNGSASETLLAGFPYHALNTYLPKLVKAGFRVAIVEQLEDPKLVKGLVKRGVTDMITPGINLNSDLLASKEHNFLAALYPSDKGPWAMALIDISTGVFHYAQTDKDAVLGALQSFAPKEVIHPRDMDRALRKSLEQEFYLYGIDSWAWEKTYTVDLLRSHFQTASLVGFGLKDDDVAVRAAGAILHHLRNSEMGALSHITSLSRIPLEDFMWLDGFTAQNLELFAPSSAGGVSLWSILDRTKTAMGGRTLKQWLSLPLLDVDRIERRLDAVEFLTHAPEFQTALEEHLHGLPDLERLAAKVATRRISPKELGRLREGLRAAAQAAGAAQAAQWPIPLDPPPSMDALLDLLDRALVADPAAALGKGETIASSYDEDLTRLRGLLADATGTLERIRAEESDRTGIPSLKLSFNNVFGYYLEVRNTHKDKVPDHWHRKQTLVNAERYITEELKTFEVEVLGAEDKIKAIETRLFEALLAQVSQAIPDLLNWSRWLGSADVLLNFSLVATAHRYTRPTFVGEQQLTISEGRHPVIERVLPDGVPYIANGISLHSNEQAIAMITGPNMSGKSAFLRQVALVQILAQTGCFVPAQAASLPIIDRLFVRVGASDNLAKGESTFMVEMNETATILNHLTPRSLVVLDEIGRGTSTFDGVSIAWGIAEYLHQHPNCPLVLFATHYHELNEMERQFAKVRNYHISVEEVNGAIFFTRQLRPGGTAHSFGLHVAKLAGIPTYVLHRAEEVLASLEQSREGNGTGAPSLGAGQQLNVFQMDRPELEELAQSLESLNLDELKPIEALMLLKSYQEKICKN